MAGGTLTLGGRDLPTSSLIEESTLGNSTHVTIPSIARIWMVWRSPEPTLIILDGVKLVTG